MYCSVDIPEKIISSQEVETMASKCKIPGCDRLSQHKKDGMCTSHFTSAMLEAGCDPKSGVQVAEHPVVSVSSVVVSGPAKADKKPWKAPKIKITPFPAPSDQPVTASISHLASDVFFLALEDAWAAKRGEFLLDIHQEQPGKQICLTAKMITAIESLGY